MELDTERIDEAVLGLLYLTLHEERRAWKGVDWDALSRLHKKGLIEDPVSKSKSVVFTSAGLEEAERAFNAQFKKATPVSQAVTYGGMAAEATSAAGVRGILCRSAVGNEYFFRVYDPDGLFTDYELRHDDLQVMIAPDELASFYKIGAVSVLDHSPKVLGLTVDSEASSAGKEEQ